MGKKTTWVRFARNPEAMAEQQSWQVTPQQHARIQHILEVLPSTLPPQHFVHSNGFRIDLDDRIMKEMMRGIGEEVKKLKVGMDGELEAVAVEVGGIVNLELCLTLAQAVAFLRMPALSHVTGLALDGLPDVSLEGCGQAMDVFFAALAQLPPTSTHLSGLTLFDHPVYGTERVCGHLAQLLTSSTAGWLETLGLRATSMRAQGMRHIAHALQSNTTLKELHVQDCPEVGDAGVEHLSAMLLKNATLDELRLDDIGMTGHAISYLCHALSSPAAALKSLLVGYVAMAADSAEHLGDMLAHNSSLEVLRMVRCELEDREGRIGQGLRNNLTLKNLELGLEGGSDLKQLFSSVASNTSLNSLTIHTTSRQILLAARELAIAIGDMLAQNRSLQQLVWWCDEEKPTGVDMKSENSHSHGKDEEGHIAQCLRNNPTLQELDIPADLLGQRGLGHLFISLAAHNTTLRTLCIKEIRSGGVPELGRMLSTNRSLQELQLIGAGYSADDWATVILPALEDNQGLKKIDCFGCRGIDGDEVFDAFINLLRMNTILEKISLHNTGLSRAGKEEVVDEELKLNKEFRATLSAVPSAKPKSCRIVLCGKEYAGKTTILQTMRRIVDAPSPLLALNKGHFHDTQKSSATDQRDKELGKRTRGIDIHVLKDAEDLRISVWDFAGHQEYHALHDIIFPGVSNGATVFVFTYSPIMGPTEREPGKIKSHNDLTEELLYWLRFIVSNMKPQHSHKPSILVFVTHKDLVEAKYGKTLNKWFVGIKNVISQVIMKFKFQDLVSMTTEPHLVKAMDGKEVATLLTHIEGLFKDKLELLPKQPAICEKVAFALQDKQFQGKPIIATKDFAGLCKTLVVGDDTSLGDFFDTGDKGWRAVAAYLDSAGEVIYHNQLEFMVRSPKWFGHGILGHLINIFSDEGFEEGRARRRNLFTRFFTCCCTATSSNVSHEEKLELPKNGLMTLGALKDLLRAALESIPDLDPNCVCADDLVELMKVLNLCFEVKPDEYLLPAIFEDTTGKLASSGKRPLKWLKREVNSWFGRRLECADRDRTFLTAGFFPKLQVVLRNKALEKKWVPDGSSSNCSLEKYLFMILVDGMQIFVEYGGFAGYFVDILVKSSRIPEETLHFVQSEIISMIRAFCASHKGCQGVILAEAVIRPECVSGPTLCAYRRDQAIKVEELTEKMATTTLSSHYMHFWSEVKEDEGFVILPACAHDAQSLIQGDNSSTIVAPPAVSRGDDRGYPKHIVVSSSDVSTSREVLVRLRFGRVVPLKFHLKCECKAGEHDVDQQPGRLFYLVDEKFATEQGWRKVLVGTAAVAAKVGGYMVPGIGVAADVWSSLPLYDGTPVYSETIESLMSMSGSTSSGTASVESLRLEVEKDLQGSLAGPWMDAFLKPQDSQLFFSDFSLRKVVYNDDSATAWLCTKHYTEERGADIFKKVN